MPVGKFLLKGKYNAAKMTPKFVKLSEYNTPLYFFLKKKPENFDKFLNVGRHG